MSQNTVPVRLLPPDISLAGLAKLTGPIFIANLAVMGNFTIDTIMAGRFGTEDLAAVALAGASTGSILMLLVGILQGLSPICGHHFGARKLERIGFEVNQAFYLLLFLAAAGIFALSQTGFWTEFGQVRGRIAELTSLYLLSSAAAIPAALVNRVFISVNAAVNRPKITMWISLLMLLLKVPVNAVFMYGMLGLPALGGAGAGISNAVLAWASMALYLGFFLKDPKFRAMHPARWYGPDGRALLEQLKIGVPIGLSVFFEVSAFTFMAIFVSRLGAVAVSAHQIVSNITATLYMVPLSVGIASSVLVAQCLGAGFPAAAEQITHRASRVALAIAIAASTMLYLLQEQIIGIYTKDPAVLALAETLILCGVLYHTFDAAQSVGSFLLRGYRISWGPMLITGTVLWGIGLGGGYLLAFTDTPLGPAFGTLGYWIACAAGLTVAGIALMSYAWLHARKVRLAAEKSES